MTNANGTERISAIVIFREVSNHEMLKIQDFFCVADFSFSQLQEKLNPAH